MKSAVLSLLYAALSAGLWADVRLPALISDHMVIQRGLPVHVWGWKDPGEIVRIEFRGQQDSATASQIGRCNAYLQPVEAGGPYTLTVRGNNTIKIEDVYVGEVWVGSGQSNLVWPLARSRDAEREIAAARHPGIRYFKVEPTASHELREDVQGLWRPVSPETAGKFSRVTYFFARHLHDELGVPIGILQSAWGGTPAEAWTSMRTLSSDAAPLGMLSEFEREAADGKRRYGSALAKWETQAAAAKAAGEQAPRRPRAPRALRAQHKPSALFNGMIAPLTPYAIWGSIWYQGESNANHGQGVLYRRLFQSMIQDWRREWGLGAFLFLFVQLADFGRVAVDSTWRELREAQAMALGLVRTGMAVTIDIGNPTDTHPRNKQDVGLRLAWAARAITYGEQDLEYSGPIFRQATRNGAAVRLWFDHIGGGLEARGGVLECFELAGPDGAFAEADARICRDTVLVSSPLVSGPVQVRYAWAAAPKSNLFNKAGLPASPFRTMR